MKTQLTISDAHDIFNKFIEDIDETINKNKNENTLGQIDAVINEHSKIHGWIRLFVNLDNQVCNGGFIQYLGNGYHSTLQNGCASDISEEDDIHQRLIELSEEIQKEYNFELGNEYLYILKYLEIEIDEDYMVEECCNTCNGQGTVESDEDEDEDESESKDCDCCDGTGEVEVHNTNHGNLTVKCEENLNGLDDAYYRINSDFIIEIASKIK